MKKRISRRHFLRTSMTGVVGTGLAPRIGHFFDLKGPEKTHRIREYRTLGRTGFKVSDIGCGYVNVPMILENLLDAGVNYIDTAESYGNETLIGNVIKHRNRKDLFITTKLSIKKDRDKKSILNRAKKCMERLQTDYLDCLMMHDATSTEILKTEGFHEAMDGLKASGKLRFVGVSNHGVTWAQNQNESMENILLAAAEDGRFDVLLLVYNFLQQKNGERILEICDKKNIGTALMKTNPIVHYDWKKNDIESKRREKKTITDEDRVYFAKLEKMAIRAKLFAEKHGLKNPKELGDGALKFCLSNPHVHTACLSFNNFDHVNHYLGVSGKRLSSIEMEKLEYYSKNFGSLYCRHGCNACESHCGEKIPINTIMRYNHYFVANGREEHAKKKYARLKVSKPIPCSGCAGPCGTACPFKLPVRNLLMSAHSRLT